MGNEAVANSRAAELLEDRNRYVPRGVSSAATVFAEHASGSRITDVDGNEYIDFAGGISVLNVGHAHPRVIAAIESQLRRLVHSGAPVMMPEPYLALVKRLCEISPGKFAKKALLVNSGAEAVENAVKVVRQATGRPYIFAFDNSFHGRTLLAMTLTGKAAPYRQNFGPYAPGVHHLPYPNPYRRPAGTTAESWGEHCLAMVEEAFKTVAPASQVAGIIIEPVLGEGGFVVPPSDFLPRLAATCKAHEVPLIADEVQTGLGRTGRLFAVEHWGVEPDLVVLAKSLAGGLPLAAVVGRAELMDATEPGGLGGTFGGNPLACAAALAVLDVLEEERLPERANRIGEISLQRMRSWQQRFDQVGDVRGLGAMVALEFVTSRESAKPAPQLATDVMRVSHQSGLLILKAGLYDNVIRLLMPLNIPDEDLERGLDILEASIHEVLA